MPALGRKDLMLLLICLGGVLRLLLILYSHYHDCAFRVKYTDIDYMVILDGAQELLLGRSPFNRTTFRYTPLLAVLMLPSVFLANPIGKLFFALCDLCAAYYCYAVLVTFATESSARWTVSTLILFNPVIFIVSTRGNSDMLVSSMSFFVLAKFTEFKYYQASAALGFAVHFKLYPVIYVIPLVLGVWERTRAPGFFQKLRQVVPLVLICGLIAVVSFAIPTLLCYAWFGWQYVNEAFLYHFYREDHRHNFSPYWLPIYLNMARPPSLVPDYTPGLFAFLPQFLVLIFVSYVLRRNVAHAYCIETMLFVAFNKVCTVQYFVWFIPFLAFIFAEPHEGRGGMRVPGLFKTVTVALLWVVTIPLWMVTALRLEFYGRNHFMRLWGVSCLFFFTTVCLAAWLARVAYRMQEAAARAKAAPMVLGQSTNNAKQIKGD